MEIIIASNNKNKVKEYQEIFEPYNIKITGMYEIDPNIDFNETGNNFKENSLLKAKTLQNLNIFKNKIILADDSGIIIDFLGKDFPGIFSHRFSKKMGGQENTNNYLIKRNKQEKLHSARFITQLTILNLKNEPLFFEGIVEGYISDEIKGSNGFGYDPIFVVKEFNKTYAELNDFEKNKISHRGKACEKFINYLIEQKLIT